MAIIQVHSNCIGVDIEIIKCILTCNTAASEVIHRVAMSCKVGLATSNAPFWQVGEATTVSSWPLNFEFELDVEVVVEATEAADDFK